MTFGSLFSGIGGLDLGLERAGMRCLWQVETDVYARRILRRHFPKAALWADVRQVGAHCLGWVDLICLGFPCQDVSGAGTGKGLEGERSDADGDGDGLEGRRIFGAAARDALRLLQPWPPEPSVGRVADGVPHHVDRLRCLGNAVVPAVAEFIGRRILAHAEEA